MKLEEIKEWEFLSCRVHFGRTKREAKLEHINALLREQVKQLDTRLNEVRAQNAELRNELKIAVENAESRELVFKGMDVLDDAKEVKKCLGRVAETDPALKACLYVLRHHYESACASAQDPIKSADEVRHAVGGSAWLSMAYSSIRRYFSEGHSDIEKIKRLKEKAEGKQG